MTRRMCVTNEKDKKEPEKDTQPREKPTFPRERVIRENEVPRKGLSSEH